ncbi:conserved membrane hypothetical protein [Rhodococcus sp. RD6.2]|jgi:hypothetical protein|uniref:hypothetical protein n=1 Tax=unclassified Rhodococcus (in: high G+C Gram-positive bacteria) TaxID=192944 RepID=UPI00063B1E36|nr:MULTISPECIES: hypothetical protein [unclassified Rhodococcus (in: high G+C Gram-positive bacteria)]CRK52542.1 conserved membrane hypothetical protein [Rhodococcus sp. RD6.2]
MSEREGARPRPVDVAYWLWLVAAALLVLFGLLALTASGDAVRTHLIEAGAEPDVASSLVTLLRGSGALGIAVGLGTGFLAGPVRAGDARFRRAEVALTGVYVMVQLLAVAVGVGQTQMLLCALLMAAAAVLVYLPSTRDWFVRA